MKSYKIMRLRMTLRTALMVSGFGTLLAITTVLVGAIPGGLDGTFGTGGRIITHITNGNDTGYAVAIQNDGKIVVAGDANELDFAVTRYNIDGSFDTAFDGDGIVVTDIGGGTDKGKAVVIQDDGKIVVAGAGTIGGNMGFAVVRYNSDGSLDSSFDGDGKVTTSLGSIVDEARAVALQDDGKIIVAGLALIQSEPSVRSDFGVVRFNTNGSLDTSFGSGGKVLIAMGNGYEYANAVAIQGDGKIVIAGKATSPVQGGVIDFALARCNANGSLDSAFGTGGKVFTSIGGNYDVAEAVAIQNDGKIVVAGTCNFFPVRFALVRYKTDGSLDDGFGSGGMVTTNILSGNESNAHALCILDDGKIMLAGEVANGSAGYDFALARYTSSGAIDTTFGKGGKVTTPIGSSLDFGRSIAIQSDGRIVVVGNSMVSGFTSEFSLARFQAGALYPASRRFDFDGDGKSDISVFRPSDNKWYILYSSTNSIAEIEFSLPTDKLVPTDYDGDGRTDIANFRDGDWRVLDGSGDVHWGQAGDVPVPGDYDGDGRADRTVFRQGSWYSLRTRDGMIGFQFGISTDKPVPEDYDGDGKFDAAIYRDGAWYMRNSTAGVTGIAFGLSTDRPVPADYDGDGKADVAVYRDGTWYILGSTSGFQVAQFGLPTDIPVPADYDGDAKADIAVYRDGVWYMLRSSDGGFAFQYFGLATDVPLESVYAQ